MGTVRQHRPAMSEVSSQFKELAMDGSQTAIKLGKHLIITKIQEKKLDFLSAYSKTI